MKATVHRKTELKLVVNDYLQNGQLTIVVSEAVQRYFQTFLVLQKNDTKDQMIPFLKALLPVLNARMIPIPSLNTLILLYNRWKNYPGIMRDLKFLTSLLKTAPSQEFWFLIIQLSGTNKDSLTLQRCRLSLLSCMFNLGVLDEHDVQFNPSVFRSILTHLVREEDESTLRNNLRGNDGHGYNAMFQHIRLVKKHGVSALEIIEMIRIHFSPPSKEIPVTPLYKEFIELLYQKLPPNFMAILYHREIAKLYFIFVNNPDLFHEWKPDVGENLKIDLLIRSLFKYFIVSEVFIRSFYRDTMTAEEKEWFAHVLHGNNIVTAKGLPIQLTRRAAHVFRCHEGGELSVTRAIIFSSIDAVVNDRFFSQQVINALHDTRNASFWVKTMSILHQNGLSSRNVTEAMDYIEQKVLVEGIQLDLKHKKIPNLLVDINNWHRQLNDDSLKLTRSRLLPDARIDDHKIEFEGKDYEIVQLKKVVDLYHEGKELHHCVYTYKGHCYSRRCYIFSLRLIQEEQEVKSLITLEIRGSQIVQAKGKYNRKPNEIELKLIRVWAQEKELSFVA
jgi:hypothetical protein